MSLLRLIYLQPLPLTLGVTTSQFSWSLNLFPACHVKVVLWAQSSSLGCKRAKYLPSGHCTKGGPRFFLFDDSFKVGFHKSVVLQAKSGADSWALGRQANSQIPLTQSESILHSCPRFPTLCLILSCYSFELIVTGEGSKTFRSNSINFEVRDYPN